MRIHHSSAADVVAIVSVLVDLTPRLFTSSLEESKKAVDLANCRSARAAATTVCLIDHNGEFSKKSTEEWVQVALNDGIPEHGQVDPNSPSTAPSRKTTPASPSSTAKLPLPTSPAAIPIQLLKDLLSLRKMGKFMRP
mgnify:CR=1 FL=1